MRRPQRRKDKKTRKQEKEVGRKKGTMSAWIDRVRW